ncbi:MAG: hypothetical protein ACQEQW_04570 [Bacteroidota bacterium]
MNNNEKTVIILAECWNGAINASRFAARLLFNKDTRIILLHTYMRPATGTVMLRDITHILKKTAEEELDALERKLVEDFNIPAGNIEKMAIEGSLKSVMESHFGHYTNISLVLGPGMEKEYYKDSCRTTVSAIMETRPGPLFLISDFITLIEQSRISVITEKEAEVPAAYIDFLKEISGEKKLIIDIISNDNKKAIKINKETARHFSDLPSGIMQNATEQVLIKSVMRANPV